MGIRSKLVFEAARTNIEAVHTNLGANRMVPTGYLRDFGHYPSDAPALPSTTSYHIVPELRLRGLDRLPKASDSYYIACSRLFNFKGRYQLPVRTRNGKI